MIHTSDDFLHRLQRNRIIFVRNKCLTLTHIHISSAK